MASRSTSLFGKDWTELELKSRVSDMSQLASVTRSELLEGKAKGMQQIQITLAGKYLLYLELVTAFFGGTPWRLLYQHQD